ncbi:MAG: sigma-54-dependent Fis family transcriptional regulator [Deltaproteobacteria bacterium]|nr:sigma-54-dependent Fis family transcriptional regulator [Deltaproteobacteria bacterium]
MLGRGDGEATGETERLVFCRQRPNALVACPPIGGPAISHEQLVLRPTAGGLELERVGRCPVLVNGSPVDRGIIGPGETLTLKHQLVLFCSRRSAQMPALRSLEAPAGQRFGEPDEHGMVGESPAAWELREQLAFTARSDRHVLLLGESGSGKELAAQAIHRLSRRHAAPLVARNAATFPPGIIDAELFGNVKDYPNPGMEARPGLIGEADGSTLFLDEIAELPARLQAHLLRVLDAGGEYQRLGDASMRRADLRIIAATNRDPSEIKDDLLARLTLRVTVPGLGDRAEDVPLLVRHLMVRAAEQNPDIGQRFLFERADGLPEARLDPELVEALLRHRHTHHVRELEGLLWRAIADSPGNYVALTPGVQEQLVVMEVPAQAEEELTGERIRACLDRHDGKVSRAWRELGLKSRYALYRLMKKHDIAG